jgi:hypothetical protein
MAWNTQYVEQALPRQSPVRLAVTGGYDTYQPANGKENSHQGSQRGQDEDNLFREREHKGTDDLILPGVS